MFKKATDETTCYDKPNKKQKHSCYEHKVTKLIQKNRNFSDKEFQQIRKVSTNKKILKSFERIGRCLNHVSRDDIPTEGYDKVCLIFINNYDHDKYDSKIGPMNDGYLFGLYHHRFGFKIFYLHNCPQGNYPKYLQFFLLHTKENLTVFYSGHDTIDYGSHGIEFIDKNVSSNQFDKLISRDNNGKCKVVFVSDCSTSGSVFNFQSVNKVNNLNPSDMISFSVNKLIDTNYKQGKRSHGLFTYYFCKFIYEDPAITPIRLSERMNTSLSRFNEKFEYEYTNSMILNDPIYIPYEHH